MNNIKGILLNLFFDDYGLPRRKAWVSLAIALCIIDGILLFFIATQSQPVCQMSEREREHENQRAVTQKN